MKKINILITIIILSSFSLTAQNKDTKKADKHFARFEFIEAAEDYKKLVEDNNLIKNRVKKMAKFASMRPGDDRAVAFKQNPDYLPKILEKGKKFNVQNMGFNSQVSDFGGTFKDGKLYITSARNSNRRTYGWNEQPFLDIYTLTKNSDGTYQPAVLLDDKINTIYHEGIVSFSPDGNTMYLSRESFFEKIYEKDSITKNRYSVLHLFRAKKSGANWNNVEGFPMNSKNYSIKNPSVSSDGKTIYFASDMPNGYGGFDIYKANINDDGSLGEPVNLGQKVNTEGQEMFPYISDNGTLYFSSNGHLGLGGLDVFHTKEIDGKIAPIRNIGIPVNSNADDFAFHLDEETGEGFVSSNREGGVGSDDIYAIKKLQPLCDVLITATVTDIKTGKPLNAATVTLNDEQGNKVVSKVTNTDGTAEFIVECSKNSVLEVSVDGYESRQVAVKGTEEEEVNVPIALDPIEKLIAADRIELAPIYFDFDKSNITSQAAFELDKLVQIMNKYPELVINATSHTDSRGSASYNERLSDRRAKTTVQYVISKGIDKSRITGMGKGESEPKVDCGTNCTEDEHQLNRRSEFIIVSGSPQAQ